MSVNVTYNYAPQILQKKRVPNKLPNTYRILFEDAYSWDSRPNITPEKVSDNFTPIPLVIPDTINSFQPKRDLRHHNPQPIHCQFLLHNARTLNAPQCFVKTKLDKDEHDSGWYNNNLINKSLQPPKFSLDSTQRSDFKDWKSSSINTRHSSNVNIKRTADNILSHNYHDFDAPRIWKENLSFEHQYNSRLDPNYPMRGKRHGAFVWDRSNIGEFKSTPVLSDQPRIKCQDDFQHKLACNRQFSLKRNLIENVDSVSRLIQPDIDSRKEKLVLPVFTH